MIRHVFLEVGFKFLVLTCDQSGSSQLYYSVGLLLKLFDHLKVLLAILSNRSCWLFCNGNLGFVKSMK